MQINSCESNKMLIKKLKLLINDDKVGVLRILDKQRSYQDKPSVDPICCHKLGSNPGL